MDIYLFRGEIFLLIHLANISFIGQFVYSLVLDKGVEGGIMLFYPAVSIDLSEKMKIWCNIQIK